MTFRDIFKNSFLRNWEAAQASSYELVVSLAISVLVGLFIYYIYKITYTGAVYNKNFNISLIAITILITAIIATISSNIVLSLGMVGALSIVRFRTAIKDPLDLTYMFWAITAGISIGAKIWIVAVLSSIILAAVIVILSKTGHFRKNWFLFIVKHDSSSDEEIKKILSKYSHNMKSRVINNDEIETIYEVKASKSHVGFATQIAQIQGVQSTTLVEYRGDYQY